MIDERNLPLEEVIALREAQYLKKPEYEQMEMESITNQVDDKEALERRREALFKRWFGYYRKCQDPSKKAKIIDQYNKICMIGKQRSRS